MTKKNLGCLFPGQGAQVPGMGFDFFSTFPIAKEIFLRADACLKAPFSSLIFKGSKEELTLTKNSQLAIFITSVALFEVVRTQCPWIQPIVCAGLSLGEYTALYAAGKASFESLLPIVKARGELMHQACMDHPGTMYVVLGLEVEKIEEILYDIEPDPIERGVFVANLNCPGQIVISGRKQKMAFAVEALKKGGAKRVLELDVAGAFHSPLMQDAEEGLAPLINALELKDTPCALVANVKGEYVLKMSQMRECMIAQVTRPVYWQKGIEKMVASGVEHFIEIGPGKTLFGMNKKMKLETCTVSIETVKDLEAEKEFHGGAHAAT